MEFASSKRVALVANSLSQRYGAGSNSQAQRAALSQSPGSQGFFLPIGLSLLTIHSLVSVTYSLEFVSAPEALAYVPAALNYSMEFALIKPKA
jgi:hypothetical protein